MIVVIKRLAFMKKLSFLLKNNIKNLQTITNIHRKAISIISVLAKFLLDGQTSLILNEYTDNTF